MQAFPNNRSLSPEQQRFAGAIFNRPKKNLYIPPSPDPFDKYMNQFNRPSDQPSAEAVFNRPGENLYIPPSPDPFDRYMNQLNRAPGQPSFEPSDEIKKDPRYNPTKYQFLFDKEVKNPGSVPPSAGFPYGGGVL